LFSKKNKNQIQHYYLFIRKSTTFVLITKFVFVS